MNIACLTYTCSSDAALAARHAAILPATWKKFWIVESKDARIAAPAGTEILVRNFPRGGSLSGRECIEGMRKVFLEFAEAGFDAVVKLDSDTALFRPEAWTAPFESAGTDFTYIRRWENESRLLANGCAYTVSRRAIERFASCEKKIPRSDSRERKSETAFYLSVDKQHQNDSQTEQTKTKIESIGKHADNNERRRQDTSQNLQEGAIYFFICVSAVKHG